MAQFDAYIRTSFKPRHLRLLVALDEIRHLGKAAASINVSQPAVSKALGELERGLELKLFERTARGVHPTAFWYWLEARDTCCSICNVVFACRIRYSQ